MYKKIERYKIKMGTEVGYASYKVPSKNLEDDDDMIDGESNEDDNYHD